ncbi:DnaJ C-terminal domain-containing protein [Paenibacillus gorillae]|uniref:DnaJ C-terminal domain-containing protein n=1 Tax=Paenibacillus gorillae TaxID=1243662 RepID=UPI001EE1ED40|nr:DnaJ C-terminal domain-containing protein [Paenibacillus gorillae]
MAVWSIAVLVRTAPVRVVLLRKNAEPAMAQAKCKKQRKINVRIPAGVDDGAQIRLSGEGEGGLRGGPAGDLYIVIRVKSHEFFERENDDIYCEVPLTFVQAALGDEIEIPTLTEKVKLKIPAGTQTGTYFRLKGKGVPKLRGYGQGDQHVKVTVVTPTKLTDEQKDLLRQFSGGTASTSSVSESNTEHHESIFDKMKKAFRGE